MRPVKALLVSFLLAAIGLGAVLWLGLYNVAADDPHWSATYRVLQAARERSIARRAAGIAVPDLADGAQVAASAGHSHGGGETGVGSGDSGAPHDHGPHDHAPPPPTGPGKEPVDRPARHGHHAEPHRH